MLVLWNRRGTTGEPPEPERICRRGTTREQLDPERICRRGITGEPLEPERICKREKKIEEYGPRGVKKEKARDLRGTKSSSFCLAEMQRRVASRWGCEGFTPH